MAPKSNSRLSRVPRAYRRKTFPGRIKPDSPGPSVGAALALSSLAVADDHAPPAAQSRPTLANDNRVPRVPGEAFYCRLTDDQLRIAREVLSSLRGNLPG